MLDLSGWFLDFFFFLIDKFLSPLRLEPPTNPPHPFTTWGVISGTFLFLFYLFIFIYFYIFICYFFDKNVKYIYDF